MENLTAKAVLSRNYLFRELPDNIIRFFKQLEPDRILKIASGNLFVILLSSKRVSPHDRNQKVDSDKSLNAIHNYILQPLVRERKIGKMMVGVKY